MSEDGRVYYRPHRNGQDLASRFSVSIATIVDVARGHTWSVL